MALFREILNDVRKNIALAEQNIKELEPEITRAQQAGIDVAADQRRLTELKETVRKMKLQYGTGK